jgi:hypothetical protein
MYVSVVVRSKDSKNRPLTNYCGLCSLKHITPYSNRSGHLTAQQLKVPSRCSDAAKYHSRLHDTAAGGRGL